MLCKLHYTLPWQREFGPPVVTIKILQLANKVRESLLEKIVTTLKAYSNIFFFYSFNPWTYTQIHTPTVVQGAGGGGNWWNPSPEFLICCSISKRFCFQWKTFDLLKKMRNILWVMALLLACDVINNEQQSGYNHDKWVFFGAWHLK